MGAETYTIEFECEAEHAKDLVKELTASPYGQRVIELLNEANFLPERPVKTQEELKAEAESEVKEREAHEEGVKESGRRDMMTKMLAKLRQLRGDDFVKAFEDALSSDEEGEELVKKFEEALAKTSKDSEEALTDKKEDESTPSISTIEENRGPEPE